MSVKNKKKKSNTKPKTYQSWLEMLECYGERKIEFPKREKSLRLVDIQYNIIMNTLREMGYGSRKKGGEVFIRGMSDIGRIKVLNFIKKCINQMELYRITWLKTQKLGVRDIDGIPHNIVQYKMKQLSEINWDENDTDGNGISGLTIEPIKDEDKTHSSQSVDKIGELYRTIEYQLLHYEMNYLNLYDDREML